MQAQFVIFFKSHAHKHTRTSNVEAENWNEWNYFNNIDTAYSLFIEE